MQPDGMPLAARFKNWVDSVSRQRLLHTCSVITLTGACRSNRFLTAAQIFLFSPFFFGRSF